MHPGRRLGIDAGQARVGVAVCDPEGILATPVATLNRRGESDEETARAIVRLAKENEVVEIIIGLPMHLSGQEGEAARQARELGDAIVRQGGGPVRMVDERLTTVQAEAALREVGWSAKRQRRIVDQAAAVVILQAALDADRAGSQAAAIDFDL
ncbi:MAG: Holliday junction resolvase RuvX [Micrococcales bacterium]|nr:Holliday junction resolvase RuvX [Micrococcales bacterium]